ncbi:hypothetical protein HanRHA438_Chr16g0755721 [Helianthus annuus]|uniref:Uncharacterized protein n=1 Tax=Helianthus annuus TaxID=4232 RepID=A0A251TZ70_HELAN|nr:hypothetical protein HanXRQr2_Chr16g0743741 [Helianthus annuus]KAJ0437821.1 hypothetical protein HanHA300_Chr16g0606611 [Helianthus annuus]KAJ0442383.1 hypothetical protein HanIR_Chr16g0808581 [Helianthus annuus]KAJ0460145.1 hypothetical protein HanHA89_Chr16g0657201 [Helianthus annuus]KAJ0640586.1 hypothetical protein HanLR1_Chr16g0617211 [Helianthus annuus]
MFGSGSVKWSTAHMFKFRFTWFSLGSGYVLARFKVGLTWFGSGQIRLGQHQVIPGQSRSKTVNKSNQSTHLVDWSKLVNRRLGQVQFCGSVMVRVPVQFRDVWFKIVTVNGSGQTWQSRSSQHAVKQVKRGQRMTRNDIVAR